MKKNIHIIIGLILIFIGLVISVFGLINTGINFNPNSFKGQITMTHDFEFVEYRFDPEKQALVRAKLPYIYRQQQIAQEDIILAPIENLRFQALDPQAQQQWPDQVVTAVGAAEYQLLQLPKGVEVTFDFQGKPYRWVYSLINTPKAAQADENIASETSGAN